MEGTTCTGEGYLNLKIFLFPKIQVLECLYYHVDNERVIQEFQRSDRSQTEPQSTYPLSASVEMEMLPLEINISQEA